MMIRNVNGENNIMPKLINGVDYDFAEHIAERFEYSVFHVRKLARDYQKGDIESGLKGVKHKGKWLISIPDAESKLTVEAKAMETHSDGESGQQEPEDKDYSSIDDL